MSVNNYIHINHTFEFARVRNDILKILSDHRDGLTLSEVSLKLGIKPNCSQDTVHQHLKYCAKTGKVATPRIANRGVVYKFLGYFKE